MSVKQSGPAWEHRVARNQALFRAINDELSVATGGPTPERLTIACECADPECVETLEIELERYAQIRSEPTHFIVLPGHVYPEVEDVIAEDARFQIVEKLGEAARVAASVDGFPASG